MVTAAKNNDYSGLKTIRFTPDFHTINKRLKYIEFDLNYAELIIFWEKRLLCFRTRICRIHCIDQFKTFNLLLKYKIIDFETLSHIHVYRIEYVWYRQGLYRIRIDTADDHIVPALVLTSLWYLQWCPQSRVSLLICPIIPPVVNFPVVFIS